MPVGSDIFGIQHLMTISVFHNKLDISFVECGLQVEAAVFAVLKNNFLEKKNLKFSKYCYENR